jgi:hypothetical protein
MVGMLIGIPIGNEFFFDFGSIPIKHAIAAINGIISTIRPRITSSIIIKLVGSFGSHKTTIFFPSIYFVLEEDFVF